VENFHYYKPSRMKDVWKLLEEIDGEAVFLGGGTDLFPEMKRGSKHAIHVIDTKEISELDYVKTEKNQNVRISANITLSRLLQTDILPKSLPLLTDALRTIGSPQIRNKATLVGNICRASPASDSVPPLICLRAKIRIEDSHGFQYRDLEDFFKGPGQTILNRGEMVTEVMVPYEPVASRGIFIKLSRVERDLATVNVAVLIELASDGITCSDARIVLGAVGPTAMRMKKCEDLLVGKRIHEIPLETVGETAMASSKPIDDVRAASNYRKEMVRVLTKRAINQTLKRLKNEGP